MRLKIFGRRRRERDDRDDTDRKAAGAWLREVSDESDRVEQAGLRPSQKAKSRRWRLGR